jgi:DNA-directed RNA polymerase specialized sigma24 family protein
VATQTHDARSLAALVDEHYGAMHRLARLVGRGETNAGAAVRQAWQAALARPDEQPAGLGLRAFLLLLVLRELGSPEAPEQALPVAPPDDFEDDGGRWAGWWKDELPATPEPERAPVERALAAIPPGLTAVLVLRDVECLDPAEVEALLGHSNDRQVALLQHGRTAIRTALRTAGAA